MKYVIGVLLILVGLALGAYVGIYIFLIGGVVDIINGIKETPANANTIAWGIAEVFVLASACGTLIAYAFGFVGAMCFGIEKKHKITNITSREVERNWERISGNKLS